MVVKNVINQMTIVELRNYIDLILYQEQGLRKMIEAQDEMINALLNLYNDSSRKTNATIEMNIKAGNIAEFESQMQYKYGTNDDAIKTEMHD